MVDGQIKKTKPPVDASAKRVFSTAWFALFICGAAILLGSFLMGWMKGVLTNAYPSLSGAGWLKWVIQFVVMYCMAIPAGIIVLRFIPKNAPVKKRLGAAQFFRLFLICFPVMYAGSLIGNILSFILSGGRMVNPVQDLISDPSPLRIVITVIAAPVFEELLFRKVLIDRVAVYGEGNAILFSAVAFGLFHGNVTQLCYAAGVGLVLAYVYVKSGKVIYTIAMHMALNFIGGVIAPWVLSLYNADTLSRIFEQHDFTALLPLIAIFAYLTATAGLVAAGIVMLVKQVRRVRFEPAPLELLQGTRIRTVYFISTGAALFYLYCAYRIITNLTG